MAFNDQCPAPAVLPRNKELTVALENTFPCQDRWRHTGANLNFFFLPENEPRFLWCPSLSLSV